MLEVSYQESVTELFLAIEEMEWRDTFDIIEADPSQVRTWVRSTGTEKTTFNWSVWRRLPIHEVRISMRQKFRWTSCCCFLLRHLPNLTTIFLFKCYLLVGMYATSSCVASIRATIEFSGIGMHGDQSRRISSSSRCR